MDDCADWPSTMEWWANLPVASFALGILYHCSSLHINHRTEQSIKHLAHLLSSLPSLYRLSSQCWTVRSELRPHYHQFHCWLGAHDHRRTQPFRAQPSRYSAGLPSLSRLGPSSRHGVCLLGCLLLIQLILLTSSCLRRRCP